LHFQLSSLPNQKNEFFIKGKMNTRLFCYLYTACSPLKIFYVFFLNIVLMSLVQDN